MKRIMRATFGDWSNDGHGRTQEALVELEGEDVSDEAIRNAFLRSQNRFGFNVLEWCSDYEESTVPTDEMDKLVEAGFDPTQFYGYSSPSADYDNGSEWGQEFDFGAAILFFIQQSLDFKWAYVTDDYPSLFGDGSGAIDNIRQYSSFVGYGLFYM